MSNVEGLDACLGDIKTWANDLKSQGDINIKREMIHNLIPILEAVVKATTFEISDLAGAVVENQDSIAELIESSDSFLQYDMAQGLVNTIALGLGVCQIIDAANIQLEDELASKRLHDAIKEYRKNAFVMIERIEEITLNPEEEDNGEEPVHGEGGEASSGSDDHDDGGSGDGSADAGRDGGSGGDAAGAGETSSQEEEGA